MLRSILKRNSSQSRIRKAICPRRFRMESLERRALLTTFFVDGGASGVGNGSPNSPFETIQEGIDAAATNDGADTVVVRSGTYIENLQIDDSDPLTLRGARGTQIHATSAMDDVISILSGDVTIQNVSVRNGKNGIVATGNSLTLRHVETTLNEDPTPGDPVEDGNGVVATDLDHVTIIGGNYSNNGNEEDQHGIRIDTADHVRLVNVTATENGQHGVDANRVGTLEVVGGSFVNNLDGDGIHVDRTGMLSIEGGAFSDNDGDGIDLRRTENAFIRGVQVNRNGNEGLEVDDSGTIVVVGSQFLENDEDGLDLDDTQNIVLIGLVSMGNGFDDPTDPGSGLQIEAEDDNDTQSVVIIGSVFSGNAADGILIVEEDTDVLSVSLTAVETNDNAESGLDISISGELTRKAVTSEGNGEPDSIMTG